MADPIILHRDSLGVQRKPAWYQGINASEAMSRFQATYYGKRRWIDDPSYARAQDKDIWEKVMRDPVIAKAIYLRLHMVTGTNVYWEPADAESRALIPYFDGLRDNITGFRKSILNLAKGIFQGKSFLRMLTNGSTGKFRIPPDTESRNWWIPWLMHISNDGIRREIDYPEQMSPDGDRTMIPRAYWTTLDKYRNEWLRVKSEDEYVRLVYHDDDDTMGYGRGVLDAIYFYFRIKTELLKFMLQGIERFATPWMVIKIDPSKKVGDSQGDEFQDPEAAATAYLAVAERMRSGNTMVMDKNDDVQLLDLSGESVNGLLALLKYFDECLVQLILAASTTTGGQGSGGTLGQAVIEDKSTSNLIRYDRLAVEESLQAFTYKLWDLNRPQFAQIKDSTGRLLVTLTPPKLKIGREQIDDPRTNMDMIQRALAAGIPIRRSEVYRMLGMPIPDSGDDVFGPPGAGGMNPGPGGLGINPMTGGPTQGPIGGPPDGITMQESMAKSLRFKESLARQMRTNGEMTWKDYFVEHIRSKACV